MVTTVRQVASWAAMVWPETDGSGLTPNIVAPTTNATAATTRTARNNTATGRKTGSTSARAAAGNRAPLLSTAPRKAGPSPGLGPMPVIFRKMATSVGRPASSPMLTHVRGRRTSLRSSTRSIRHLPSLAAALRRRAGAAGPGGTAGPPAGQREEHVLEGGALDHQLADGHAAGDQVAVEGLRAGAVELHHQAVGSPLPQLHPWQAARQLGGAARVGGGHAH